MGHRALIAIVGQGAAALNHFPTAKIRNAAGDYVRPSNGTMAAALSHMSSDGSGTRQVNLSNKDPRAYPLTMVTYAMVPTSGLSHAKAAAIARFLDFAAGPARPPASGRGSCPRVPARCRPRCGPRPGSWPWRSPTRAAATAAGAAGGRGRRGGGTHSPGASPASSPPSSSTAGAGASPSVSQPAATTAPRISLAAAHPQPAALTRFALPALLILGGLSALRSSALLGTSEGGIRGRLRALGAGTAALGRSAWTRVRPNRTAAKCHAATPGRPARAQSPNPQEEDPMTTVRALARQAVRIGAALGLASLGLATAAQPAGASTYTSISGSGSSWASVALDQWSRTSARTGSW